MIEELKLNHMSKNFCYIVDLKVKFDAITIRSQSPSSRFNVVSARGVQQVSSNIIRVLIAYLCILSRSDDFSSHFLRRNRQPGQSIIQSRYLRALAYNSRRRNSLKSKRFLL